MFVECTKSIVKFPIQQEIRIFWKDCSTPEYFVADYIFFSVAGLFQICNSEKCSTLNTEEIEKIEKYDKYIDDWKEICVGITSYNRFNSFWEKLW